MNVLTRTVTSLSSASDLADVTSIVAAATREVMGCDGATFVLREDDLCYYADEDAISPLWKGSRFPMSACISGWSMSHAETVVIPDIYLDDRIPHDAYRPTFVRSLCMVPVRVQSPIAALGAYWRDSHVPSLAQQREFEVLANSAAVALENLELRGAVLRRSAERDALEAALHSMVHDLRNPLGAMIGYADLLEEDPHDVGRVRSFAHTIVEAGERMSQQIEVMLAVYGITHRPLEPELLDLAEMGREVVEEVAMRHPGRPVGFDADDRLRVVADPVLARVLLGNLLDNAWKYTAHRADPEVRLGCADPSRPLSTFYVRDNGAGFEPSQASRLFQPLSRLHTTSEFTGTGLGLASVARIVQMHGGGVRAEGAKDAGATIYFELPAAV